MPNTWISAILGLVLGKKRCANSTEKAENKPKSYHSSKLPALLIMTDFNCCFTIIGSIAALGNITKLLWMALFFSLSVCAAVNCYFDITRIVESKSSVLPLAARE